MELDHVSASQVEDFERCQRLWYFKKVLNLPVPGSKSQALGTALHSIAEEYINSGGKVLAGELTHLDIFHPVIEILPPLGPELMTEHEFRINTYTHGPKWVGYIDLFDPRVSTRPVVYDFKSTSDTRYAKTPEDLRKGAQMVAYAWWALETTGNSVLEVEVAHLYMRTRDKPKAWKVSATLTPDEIRERWAEKIETVKKMVLWARLGPATADSLPAAENPKTCEAYGGCPFRRECGLTPTLKSSFGGAAKMGTGISLSDKLTERLKRTISEKVAEKVAQRELLATPPEILPDEIPLLPPDAPPRDSLAIPVAVADEPTADVKGKRTRKAKDEAQAPAAKGFKLYLDCCPMKGDERRQAVLFEDFIAPFTKKVAEEHGLPDFRLIEYGRGSVALAMAVRASLESVPPVLLVSGHSPGAQAVLDVLIPHATSFVRALKG